MPVAKDIPQHPSPHPFILNPKVVVIPSTHTSALAAG
jgi:hypothetical protein